MELQINNYNSHSNNSASVVSSPQAGNNNNSATTPFNSRTRRNLSFVGHGGTSSSLTHNNSSNSNFRHGSVSNSSNQTATKRVVDWIQSLRVPLFLVRKYRKLLLVHSASAGNASTGNASTEEGVYQQQQQSGGDHDNDSAVIYWISGLDRVLLPSSNTTHNNSNNRAAAAAAVASCCAEAVLVAGIKPPRYLWYMLSGAACDVMQIATLSALSAAFAVLHDTPAACWCVAFILSIPVRHVSHRYLVFGDYVGGYARSLARMYAGYSAIIVLSTAFNYAAGKALPSVSLLVLSLLTMLWTGVANYFILKYFWSFGNQQQHSSVSNTNKNSSSTTTS